MGKNKKVIIGILIVVLIVVIIVGYELIKNNMKNSEDFKATADNISSNPIDTIDNEENEKSFYGKIIESNVSYIIVEPYEDEEEKKTADRIFVGLGENNEALYMVGMNVKITYDGIIMESYPAQIKATKIELKSADDFEIFFDDKNSMESLKIYTILDKSETDKYNYTIYGYGRNVNIRIDGKEYSLKEALLENRITMEEIIAKANEDERNGIIRGSMYQDGGSIEYHYEDYTIIKCHTLDGNRDVYIGTKDLKLNDVI